MPQDESQQKMLKHEYDLMLIKRRRYRAAKACYPCRRRKVKCDLNHPCESCNIRGHPDLCNYNTAPKPASSSKADNAANPASSSASDREATASTVADDLSRGLYVNPVAPYETKLHLGPESLPSLLARYQSLSFLQQQQDRNNLHISTFETPTNPQTIFELLCLQDSSAVMPFTNLWRPEDGPEVIYNALPEDESVNR